MKFLLTKPPFLELNEFLPHENYLLYGIVYVYV